MLDQKILERARGLINPAIHQRRKHLQGAIAEITQEMMGRGIYHSSMTAQRIAELCETELRERTHLAWGRLKKVHTLLGAPQYPELLNDFKLEIGIHRKEALQELVPLIPTLANTAYTQEISLNDADWRIEQEINAEIDLYVDSIKFVQPTRSSIEGSPLIFISCGQYTAEEIGVGDRLARIVAEKLAPCQGYFAQNVNSLEGLSKNILGALNQCVGFVAVMHHRGNLTTPNGTHTRASVWVEQELAIAAFLTQAQQRPLAVAAYIQRGIKREGIRDQLHLNPTEFDNPDEIIRDFELRIADHRFSPQTTTR
jgi:hypothetical protein